MDGEKDSVIARVGAGSYPKAIVYNQKNNRVYCANRGSNNITILDGAMDVVLGEVNTGESPFRLLYDSLDNRIYCLNQLSSSITVINCSSPTEVETEEEQEIITDFSLSQNFPNPFNSFTTIQFNVNSSQLTESSAVTATLTIHNILGRKVKTLVNERKSSGTYQVVWDGMNEKGEELATGIYFCRLKLGDYSLTKKMLLLR
jgi:YVTN family beta-propeller protein